jgi:hypothetical protein
VATWAKLTGERPPTLSSTTPSTGQHHFFRYVEGIRNLELDALAPGVEIKAEGGYVVVPPSFCTAPKFGKGASYVWSQPLFAPAPAPDWLVVEILAASAPPCFAPPSSDHDPVAVERIEAALDRINPDIDRKSWIAIGCALFKELGDEGFEFWNEWSSRGQKYKAREMGGQWKAISNGNGYAYSIGTLFWLANQEGEL